MEKLSPARAKLIFFMLLGLYPLIGAGIDLITPSLPHMMKGLHVSAAVAKNFITLYLLGYALGNFLVGIVSDAWGRQKMLLGSLLFFAGFSVLPVFFPSATLMLWVRFLQGFMIAAFSVLARSVASDILTHDKLIQVGAKMALMWGVGPVLGPVVGGYLQHYIGWQACFTFYMVYGLLGFLGLVFVLPETHTERKPFSLPRLGQALAEVFNHQHFMGLTIVMGLTYSLLISFNVLGPFFVEHLLGYNAVTFGHLSLLFGVGFIGGTFVCRRLVKQWGPIIVVQRTLFFMLVLSFIFWVLSYFFVNSLWLVMVASIFMAMAAGIIFPASLGKCMTYFRHIAGTASASMYLVNILMTVLVSFALGFVVMHSATALMLSFLGLLLVAFIVRLFCLRGQVS